MGGESRLRAAAEDTIRTKVETYLTERRQAGFRLKHQGTQLLSFARFAERRCYRGPMTTGLAIAWALAARRPCTVAARYERLQAFAKFWNRRDPANHLLAAGVFGKSYPRVRPHIYTLKEIHDLINAARHWPTSSRRAAMYATVLGLLASTGLRLSEALKLRCEDVDLGEGILTIRESKGKSRYVPLHPSTTRALDHYAKRYPHERAAAQIKHFFSIDGRSLSPHTITFVFRKLRRNLGWRCRGDRSHPRIHDLRFTFICRRVERWYAQNRDVNHLMLSLSTYVGHINPSATYWYLTATPKLMSLAARRFVLPERRRS
jgi:integrase